MIRNQEPVIMFLHPWKASESLSWMMTIQFWNLCGISLNFAGRLYFSFMKARLRSLGWRNNPIVVTP